MPAATEFVRVTTSDGVRLEGALFTPESPAAEDLGVDAFLLLHGTGSNFHQAGALEAFAERALEEGFPVLRVDTRGHDGMATLQTTGGRKLGGAAFEDVSECPFDVAAWVGFLVERGFERVALVGHSMGGVKATYTLAVSQDAALAHVTRLIIVSSPRFHHETLTSHDGFRADWNLAQQFVDAGEPETLLHVTQPMPFVVTAAGFLAKYGPDDEYDIVRRLAAVSVPTLYVLGTASPASSPAFRDMPERLADLARTRDGFTLELVEGANTGYTRHLDAPGERAFAWLRG